MGSHGFNLILVLIAIGGSINIVNARCNGTCDRLSLPYPFGFSDGCPIRFSCSRSGLAMIGNFSVENLTGDSIYVAVPPDCNRTTEDMKPLFGELYVPSSETTFLMEKCTRPTDGCSIRQSFLETQLKMKSCDAKGNIRCFSVNGNTTKFFSMENLRQSSCRLLFSSIAFESGIAIELKRVRLSWWLKGVCRNKTCSENAVCTQVDTPGGNSGYRCSCPAGKHGDGFNWKCSDSEDEDEDTVLDMVDFYSSLIVTYVIVFAGLLVLLCFESRPRQAWLSLVDNFIHLARRTLG